MAGIFGLLDPDGIDAAVVRTAAQKAAYRGEPQVATSGPLALGIHAGHGAALARGRGGDLTAGSARIDGWLHGGVPRDVGEDSTPVEVLGHLVRGGGPTALDRVAADFALAVDTGAGRELTLAVDAFGTRPIFWARSGRRFGFASDPAVLFALGLASGAIDLRASAAYLARRELDDGSTGFDGVRALSGGTWIRTGIDGRFTTGRWFLTSPPNRSDLSLRDAAEGLADLVTEAVRSRAGGRRTALALSAGRDSGSLAIALQRAGIHATCITQVFAPDVAIDEVGPARSLAAELGHRWRTTPVTSRPARGDLDSLPRRSGSPFGHPAFPLGTALFDAAEEEKAEVLLTGEGGEPLLGAPPIAVWDFVRQGRLRDAVKAAGTYDRDWTYDYRTTVKAALRGMAPRRALAVRERMRPVAPWVRGPIPRGLDPMTAPRSAHEHLILALTKPWGSSLWASERMGAATGVELAFPLLDRRIVDLVMSLPQAFRAPVPEPKPLLALGLLGSRAGTRKKVTYGAYYQRLAANLQRDFPMLFQEGMLAAKVGLIDPSGLSAVCEVRWAIDSLSILPIETWLRRHGA